MNIDVLKLVKSISENWVVAEFKDTGRLFCNGHIICLAGNLDLGSEANSINSIERMTTGMMKMWREVSEAQEKPAAIRGKLCGDSLGSIARRFHLAYERLAHFNERYVRCFDKDAVFHGFYPHQRFVISEGGIKVGLIMPMLHYDDFEPFDEIPDFVLFHECPVDGCDD